MQLNDKNDAFDWSIALYYWTSHYHDGMFSDKYAALSKITEEYSLSNIPDINFDSELNEENEMIIMNYHELAEENWEEYFDKYCLFMDNEYETAD